MTVARVSSEADTEVDTSGTGTSGTGTSGTGASRSGPLGVDSGAAGADSRHARALAALRSAEARTGVRKQATAARAVQTVRAESSGAQVRALPGGLANGPTAASAASRPAAPRSAASASTTPRSTAPSSATSASVPPKSVTPKSVTPKSATPTSRATPSSGGRAGSPDPGQDARVLPVHPRLAALLPDGGLRTGTTVVVRGSTSLLLSLLAEASSDGAWTVLVGYPAAGMAAAADAGCDLTRTLVVPLPASSGVDAPAVLAALIDGMDVVVVGPEVALLEQDRRRLAARARERGTVLVAVGPAPVSSAGPAFLPRSSAGRGFGTRQEGGGAGWAGAHVVLEATAGDWAGIDQGAGWLRRRTLRVRRTGRGGASRPLHLEVEVPVCRAGGGAERAEEEHSVAREAAGTAVPDGDVVRRSGSESRLGLVG